MSEENNAVADIVPSKEIAFYIPPKILNLHMLATSKDQYRSAIHKTINFKCTDGVLHVCSTDGRVMFHTVIEGEGYIYNTPNFNMSFIFDRAVKMPKGKYKLPSNVVIKDGVFSIRCYREAFPQLFPQNNEVFPSYEHCELGDEKEHARIYKAFRLEYLGYVSKYIDSNFHSPFDSKMNMGIGPREWYQEEDNGNITKKATVMPMRVD